MFSCYQFALQFSDCCVHATGKWEWMCESPSLLPPCEGAVSYYSQFGRVVGFTTAGPGKRFRKILEEHLELLRWPSDLPAHKELSVKGEDGKLYHWILPSFFQLLQDLTSQGIEFSVFFRTFGTDLPRLLMVVQQALEHGTHPLFPVLPELKVNAYKRKELTLINDLFSK